MTDSYSRLDYRRLIAWPDRIQREAALIRETLAEAPSHRILDLGSGTGEHSRFLAGQGFEVVGIDASESMIERARDEALPPGLSFVHGSITRLEEVADGTFGGAICLGNTLPHLRSDDEIAAFAQGLRALLLPGAALLLQLINYERILGTGQRHLPLNFRSGDDDEEIVFLRLMTPHADGSVLFYPTTLRLRPGREPAIEVVTSREVNLRGWVRSQLEAVLHRAGFDRITTFGAFDQRPYLPLESADLILVAR